MAKQEPTTQVEDTTPEVADAAPRINPDDVPGTAKTILSTRPGYAFESGVEGVDTITEHGTRVAKDKIQAVLDAAAPSGDGFITVTEG